MRVVWADAIWFLPQFLGALARHSRTVQTATARHSWRRPRTLLHFGLPSPGLASGLFLRSANVTSVATDKAKPRRAAGLCARLPEARQRLRPDARIRPHAINKTEAWLDAMR